MSTIRWTILTVAILLVVAVVISSMYVVAENEYAIVLQFGRVVSTRTEPGLYFKTPFVQSVVTLDRRLREWDGEPSNLLTVEKERIEINTWARWRISDPRKFYEALKTESAGQGVLDGLIDASVKNVIATQPLMEVLRNTRRVLKYREKELEEAEAAKGVEIDVGRDRVVAEILAQASKATERQYGFAITGLAVKHINYVRDVIPKIYERMRSERIRIANRLESEGREMEAQILGDMSKELETIESKGYQESTMIRGEADAEAIQIYADAYGRDPDFYSFRRTLEILPDIMGSETHLVLGIDDSDLFRCIKTHREREPER